MSDTMVPNPALHAEALLNKIGPSKKRRAKQIFNLTNVQAAQLYPCGIDYGFVPTVTHGSITAHAIMAHAISGPALIGHAMTGNTITGRLISGHGLRDVFLYTPSQVHVLSSAMGRMEKIQRDLERLRDGWAGQDSKAPSSQTLTDFERLVSALPSDIRLPEVEVDDETGYVTLRWSSPIVGLSFVLRGSGKALFVRTTVGQPTVVSSRTFDLGPDTHGIARYLATSSDYRAVLETA